MRRIAPAVARALRLSVVEGSLFAVYWNVVAGIIVNGLALALGAGALHIAVLNALPLLSQVFGVFAARFLQDRDARKPLTLAAEGLSRAIWVLVPLLLLLPGGPIRVWFVLVVAAMSHVAHSAGVVGWISWVSDLVPEGIRGTYFGLRTAICGLTGVIGVTLASAWADGFAGDAATEGERLSPFLLLIAASLVFSGGSWVLLLVQPVRRMHRRVTAGWRAIWESLSEKGGRRILQTWCLLALSTGVTMGIYMMFFLDRLKMGMTGVAVYAWIALGVSTLMTPALGRFADRFGHRNLLLLAWGGVFWQPLLSVLTPDDMPHLFGLMPVTILIDAFAGGCFWPAVGLAQTNLVIAQASSERRAGLFASLSALTGVIGFGAAILGGLIAEGIGDRVLFHLGGVPVGDLRFPMLVGAVLRLLAGLTIFRITEPPRSPAGAVSGQGFTLVWRLLIGKPVRPVER